jgi:hypothetical protein
MISLYAAEKNQRRIHAARSWAVSNNLQTNYITCPDGTLTTASAHIFDKGLQKTKLIVLNFFIKTFWGLNLLPSSDMRYSTKDVCSVGPFRLSLYHWTTKDILRGIFSSRRQGFELPIRTVDRTEHEAQCAKSSFKWKPQLRTKHVKRGVSVLLKNSLLHQYRIYARANTHTHTQTHARTYSHHNEREQQSASPSRASKEKCVNFGAM